MAGQDLVRVEATVIEKDGKIDYVYTEGEIAYYISQGWQVIGHEELYI